MRLDGQHRPVFATRGLVLRRRLSDVRKRCDYADQRRQNDDFNVHNEPSSLCRHLRYDLAGSIPSRKKRSNSGTDHHRGKESVSSGCVFMVISALHP